MEELVRKIKANYMALANLENIRKSNSLKETDESYLISKKHIMDVLEQHLEEYKQLTGIEFELSEEIKTVLNYGK